MGKEGHVTPLHPVWNPLPLQKVNERQGTFVIPIKHRRYPFFLPGLLKKVLILGFPVPQRDPLYLSFHILPWCHVLFVPCHIFLDKAVCRLYNPLPTPVIAFHQKHRRPRMYRFEIHQCLRIGRPEPVDALVFIAHHEKIAAFFGKQPDHVMLDLRSILRFIHAEIAVAFLKM